VEKNEKKLSKVEVLCKIFEVFFQIWTFNYFHVLVGTLVVSLT